MRRARARRLIPEKPRAAIDATGYEARHVSRSFAWRSGHRERRAWPPLTAALETRGHLLLAAPVGRGPSQDSPRFKPATRAAVAHGPIGTMLADGAFDAERDHAYARERLGIRATAIPLDRRDSGRKWPRARYRRRMVERFRERPRRSRHRRAFGQRWRAESGFSRNERLLGSALRARRWPNQKREALMRVLTHNLMLLGAA